MKKAVKKLSALSMATVIAAGLADCSGSTGTTTATNSKVETQAEAKAETQADGGESQVGGAYTATDPVETTFVTQDVGITTYVYASTMADLSSGAFPGSSVADMTTTSPGGVGSPVILESKQCSAIISNGALVRWAARTGTLENPPTESVGGLASNLDETILNVISTRSFVNKTDVVTAEELVTQRYPVRIAVKSSRAFGELAYNKVSEVLGVGYEDTESQGGGVTQAGSDAVVSLLKDGKVNMTIDHIVPRQSATFEPRMTAKMYFPQLSDDTPGRLTKEGFSYTVISTGAWPGQKTGIKTVGSPQVILISADLGDVIVYTMTKALYEDIQTLINANAVPKAFGPETVWKPIKLRTPAHPDTEAYYREMGHMKQMKFV